MKSEKRDGESERGEEWEETLAGTKAGETGPWEFWARFSQEMS